MKTRKRKNTIGSVLANLAGKSLLAAAAFALVGAGTVDAGPVDMFGGWAEIGDPGNAYDTVTVGTDPDVAGPWGKVGYTYSIGKYEVSNNDYESVMNQGTGNDRPKASISMYGAMEFANKLTTDAGGTALYEFDTGGTFTGVRKSRADLIADGEFVYALPTEDEWYKAAYYNVGEKKYYDYAIPDDHSQMVGDPAMPKIGTTGTDDDGWNYSGATTGDGDGMQDVGFSTAEQNGTRDMMGNAWETLEDSKRLLRGGHWNQAADKLISSGRTRDDFQASGNSHVGFRVVAIPEPASLALLGLAGLGCFLVNRLRRRQ